MMLIKSSMFYRCLKLSPQMTGNTIKKAYSILLSHYLNSFYKNKNKFIIKKITIALYMIILININKTIIH